MTTDEAIQQKWDFRFRNRNLPWYPRGPKSRDTTRRALAQLFVELGFNVGVEVGTRSGSYAMTLCKANKNLKLTCVDPWIEYQGGGQRRQNRIYREAINNLRPLNVDIRRETSMEGVKEFEKNSLDFVYIDGNHLFDFAMTDIIFWTPKVRKEGIVAVHDYHPYVGSDVMWAVNAYTHCHGIYPWYVTRELEPTAFWVKK